MILLRNSQNQERSRSTLQLKPISVGHLSSDLTSYSHPPPPTRLLPSGWGSGHTGCSWIHRRSAWRRSWRRNPRPAARYHRGRKTTPGHRSRTGSTWCCDMHREKQGHHKRNQPIWSKEIRVLKKKKASLTRRPWSQSPERCGQSMSPPGLQFGSMPHAHSHKIMPCRHSTARWPPGRGRALPQCTGYSNHNNLRGHNISAHRRHTPHI